MRLINKLEQDRWFNWQDSLLKLGLWDRFSQEGWTAEPGSCSQRESRLVFSVLVAEQEDVLGIDLAKGLCLQFWQHGRVLIASINDADVQKAAVSIWLCLLIRNLDSRAIHKVCSSNACSGVLLCKAQQQSWLSNDPTLLLGRSHALFSHGLQLTPQD